MSAASTLVHSGTKRKAPRGRNWEGEQAKDGADALSSLKKAAYRPGEIVRKPRTKNLYLKIVNPESLGQDGKSGDTTEGSVESAPGTPWDKEMRALEKKEHDGYNQAAVSTPSQQKDFLAKVRRQVQTGDVSSLKTILRAAAAAAESRGDEEKIGTGISPRSTQVQTENRQVWKHRGKDRNRNGNHLEEQKRCKPGSTGY